jgi:hypothetical protein
MICLGVDGGRVEKGACENVCEYRFALFVHYLYIVISFCHFSACFLAQNDLFSSREFCFMQAHSVDIFIRKVGYILRTSASLNHLLDMPQLVNLVVLYLVLVGTSGTVC